MKVLVTGGCGFLGSHVCEFYANRGDTVIAFDNMTKYELNRTGYSVEEARNYNTNYLNEIGVIIIKEDIRDFDTLMEYCSWVDFIVHTTAQPAMTISLEDPELDFSTNLIGTFNVLRVVKELRIPMVSCGTIHIYGNRINESLGEESTRYVRNPAAIDESHPTVKGILTPLHASKRSAELYIETFIHSYGLCIASFRLTGLYGPRQFGGEDHGWVANFSIRNVLGMLLTIFGTGKQLRDILYATDVAEAFYDFYNNYMTKSMPSANHEIGWKLILGRMIARYHEEKQCAGKLKLTEEGRCARVYTSTTPSSEKNNDFNSAEGIISYKE